MTELIQSQVQTSSEEFQQNREHHAALSQEVREAVERVREGGSKDAVERHHSRGKLLPRERIDRILDPGSPFLELSPFVRVRRPDFRLRDPDDGWQTHAVHGVWPGMG